MTRAGWKFATVATVITGAAIARAQPAPPDPIATDPPLQPNPVPPGPPQDNGPLLGGATDTPPIPADPYQQPVRPPHHNPDRPIDMPTVLTTPTGWLLPAAVLYSKTSLDTGGGVSSDNRIGLGDVAEFGLASTDRVRESTDGGKTTSQIEPYLTATFRMGVAEGRLFQEQPGITLGFEKSFERDHDGFKTRIAELTLVASKKIGERTALHVGGAFFDASLSGQNADGSTIDTTLHDRAGGYPLAGQIRPFGGLQVRPIAKSEILVDLGWAPEFCYACAAGNQIALRPQLSWGVRYEVADWMHIESGVRVPDIGNANLLNAQIFGSLTFTSWGLRHGIDALK